MLFCEEIQKNAESFLRKFKIDGKSENTIKSYSRTYKYFAIFCKLENPNITFNTITEDDIYSFLEYKSRNLQNKEMISNATAAGIVVHLKRLFKYIERNSIDKLYDFDRVFDDIKIKTKPKEPKGLDEEESKKLLEYIKKNRKNDNFLSVRNSFLFKILYYSALRASEAILISLDDFILDKKEGLYSIPVTGKGDKKRVTFIKEDTIKQELSILKNTLHIDTSKPVALTAKGKNMDRVQLYKVLNKIYRDAGITQTGVHILRHTAAKNFLSNGVGIASVQSILGHTSLETTSIYTKLTEDAIKKDLKNI